MRVPAAFGDVVEALGDAVADVKVVELRGGIIAVIPADVETALKLQAVVQANDEAFGDASPLPPTVVLISSSENAGKVVRALTPHFAVLTSVVSASVARDIERHNAKDLVIGTETPRDVAATGARPARSFDPSRN